MSDDRDLDELLESLDALLREGGSHNDDAVAEEEPEPARPQSVAKKPVQPAAVATAAAAKAPAAPPQKSDAAGPKRPVSAPKAGGGEAEAEELPHFLAEPKSASGAVAAASAKAEPAAPEPALEDVTEDAGQGNQAGQPMHRVVLTEEMLIGNHQASLPLGQRASAEAVQPRPADQGAAPGEEVMERLVAEVFRDVSDKLQAELPVWIEQAIRQRLHMLKTTDQKKEQDNE